MKENVKKAFKKISMYLTVLISVILIGLCPYILLVSLVMFAMKEIILALAILLIPAFIPIIFLKKKKIYLIIYTCVALSILVAFCIQTAVDSYQESITIDVTPSINTNEYLPFDENSKITNYEELMEQVINELAKYGFTLSVANTDMSGGESGKADRYVTLIHESGIKIVIQNNHTKYLWVYFCDLETPK